MVDGAARGRWRHQQWSLSWILPRITNQVKIARNSNFFVLYVKNNTYIITLNDFSHNIYFYCWKKLKKCIFTPKRLDHLVLMASSLVTIATDHYWTQTVSKCARGMIEQLLKTSGADVLSSRKKLKKTFEGLHQPPLVRPRVKLS